MAAAAPPAFISKLSDSNSTAEPLSVSYTHLEEKIKPAVLDSFESITGKGIKASYEGHTYWVGSHKLLKDFSATVNDAVSYTHLFRVMIVIYPTSQQYQREH